MTTISSQDLCKLLYYNNSTPLSETNIENTTTLLFNNIYPTPIIPNITDEAKTFISIILDDFSLVSSNTEYKTSKILFNIISHIDLWMIDGGIRPYSIMTEIDKLFNEQRIIGIGKLSIERANWIAANEKFQGYRMVYKITEFN